MITSLDVSTEESEELKQIVDEMNCQAKTEEKLQVFRLKALPSGSVTIQLNENRGGEGLELLFMLLRRLERFQKPSWP